MKLRLTAMLIFMTIGFVSLLCSNLSAQEEEHLEQQLKNIKGTVSKITVEHEGGTEVFTGNDAEKLGDMLKNRLHTFTIITEDSDLDGDFEWYSFEDEKGINKEIRIEKGDGEDGLVVTVTTTENGEEKTEVYKGEEAEKFLEEHQAEHGGMVMKWNDEDFEDLDIIVSDAEGKDEDNIKIFIRKTDTDTKKEIIIKKKKETK